LTRALTIDSFAWVEQVRGSRLGAEARRLIDQADECYTPTIVLAELAHRWLRDGLGEEAVRREIRLIGEASRIIPIDPELAIGASHAAMELRRRARERRLDPPGLADGLVLATARRFEARLLTGDRHFFGLDETVWLE
jgi:predicted nucleic acid-binding protein